MGVCIKGSSVRIKEIFRLNYDGIHLEFSKEYIEDSREELQKKFMEDFLKNFLKPSMKKVCRTFWRIYLVILKEVSEGKFQEN